MYSVRKSVTLITLAIAVTACGAAVVPSARIASTEAAISAAREIGAHNVPSAALYLHYAELQRGEAQRLAAAGELDSANLRFLRAEADANLSLALTRESVAQGTARQATQTLNASPGGVQ